MVYRPSNQIMPVVARLDSKGDGLVSFGDGGDAREVVFEYGARPVMNKKSVASQPEGQYGLGK